MIGKTSPSKFRSPKEAGVLHPDRHPAQRTAAGHQQQRRPVSPLPGRHAADAHLTEGRGELALLPRQQEQILPQHRKGDRKPADYPHRPRRRQHAPDKPPDSG